MLVEIATFRLTPGADTAAFLAADAVWQEALMAGSPGFVRRTVTRDVEGREWAVITLWGTRHDADAADARAPTDDAGRAFNALIDDTTRQVRRYETSD